MWPSPWHLKRLLVLIGLGFGRIGGAGTFCGAWVLCGLKGKGFCGLGTGWELDGDPSIPFDLKNQIKLGKLISEVKG